MNQIANSVTGDPVIEEADGALELRLFRVMILSVVAASLISMALAPWRISCGIMLGGGLSLLNFYWLRTSVSAIFRIDHAVERPRVRISSYILRYLMVGIVVFAAYQLRIVSLAAAIAGLCAFVPALFVEAGRQFYFAIIHREEPY
jgi:ATP synthase I subunit